MCNLCFDEQDSLIFSPLYYTISKYGTVDTEYKLLPYVNAMLAILDNCLI